MISDEDAVRTLMRESDIPSSRLVVDRLMSDSRRSRRRRVTAVGGAVLAVVAVAAVAVPAALVRTDEETSPEPSADFATTVRVVHRPTLVGEAADCTATPLRRLDGDDPGMFPGVFDADASGERIIGSSRGGKALTLWTRGEPTQFTVPDAIDVTATAVNGNGVVVGFASGRPLVSFRYRDGDLQVLANPEGAGRAAVAEVNGRGDALGAVATAEAFDHGLALVVWPAAEPDRPRVVAGPLPGVDLHPLAIRDDGTVIALHTEPGKGYDEAASAVVVYRPDGTQLRIDAPKGVAQGSMSATGVLHGDTLFTTEHATETMVLESGRPAVEISVSRPVRWNLKTGLVEIFDNATPRQDPRDGLSSGSLIVGNARGWLVAGQGRFERTPVLIAPNGRARTLTAAKAVGWVSADGSSLAGITEDGTAVMWRC